MQAVHVVRVERGRQDPGRRDAGDRLQRRGAEGAHGGGGRHGQERAVEEQPVDQAPTGPAAGPQGGDQPTGGVPVDQQPAMAVLLADDPHRLVQFLVVGGEVADEVRRVVRAQRAAVLAQVDRVEGEAGGHVVVGEVGLEPVVVVTVDVEDGLLRTGDQPAHQRRRDLALLVRAQRQLRRLVGGTQDVFAELHGHSHPISGRTPVGIAGRRNPGTRTP